MLRQDDRSFITVIVALGSVLALVAGTSAFFLIHSCAVTSGQPPMCHAYPSQVYILLPGPVLAGCALLVSAGDRRYNPGKADASFRRLWLPRIGRPPSSAAKTSPRLPPVTSNSLLFMDLVVLCYGP